MPSLRTAAGCVALSVAVAVAQGVAAPGPASVRAADPVPLGQAAPVGSASASAGSSAIAAQRCFGAASRDPRARCRNGSLRRAVEPSPFDAILEPNEPCQPLHGVGLDACTFGASRSEATRTIALIGDSHATHWRAALAEVAESEGFRGISITRSGCPLTLATSRGGGSCAGWAQRVLTWLGENPEITGVVTSASTGARVTPPLGVTPRGAAMQGYRQAWAAIPPSVRDVWVIRDVPHMSWDTLTCVNEAIEDVEDAGKLCARRRPDALKTDLAAVTTRSAPVARVHLLDLTAFMCDARRCFPVVGGALVSKDAGHLTRTFSLTMGPYLRRAMNATQVPAPLPAPTPTPSPTSTPSPAFISPPLNTTTP